LTMLARKLATPLRVLFISQVYPPEPEVRVSSLAEALAERGHHVTVFTAFPSYPNAKLFPGFRQSAGHWEVRNRVQVLRLPSFINHSARASRRALSYASFAAASMGAALTCLEPADVVANFHPPLTAGPAGLWAALSRRAPLVFDIQDLWPDVLVATGMARGPVITRTVSALMNVLYRRAAAVTVVCPGFRKRLMEAGVPSERVHFFPLWVDDRVYRPLTPSQAVAREWDLAGKFNVMFAGAMGIAQGLDVVVEAARLLRDLGDVQFVLIGDGADLARLKALATTRRAGNVAFVPRQPAERMAEFFSWAAGLLVHLRDSPGFRLTIPSKTQSYMACGRPVIMAAAGEGADFVRSHGVGLVCPPENPEALAQAVRKLYQMSPEERGRMGEAGRAICMEMFAKSKLVGQYEELLHRVVVEHRAPAGRRG